MTGAHDPALPDAAPANWVDRRAPAALRPWLRLGRFDRPIGIWLLVLPGWQGLALAAAERRDLREAPLTYLGLIGLFLMGAALMRAAGCAYNDIVDRDLDRKVARTADRPVASGRLTRRQAWVFVIGASLAALAILVSFNPFAIGLGAFSTLLVAAYPFMKRITWWPQAWLGLTFNWGALLGYAAAQGSIGTSALVLYASGLFWTLGYDTIYALQDLEDDALVGVRSSARRLGRSAPRAVLIFYAVAAGLAGLSLALAAGSGAGPGALVVAAILWLGFSSHLIVQARAVQLDSPRLALALFRSNRQAGLLLFAAFVALGFG